MQNNSFSRREAIHLYKPEDKPFVQRKHTSFTNTNITPNAAAVPKLTFKDKAGLVFVVAVLLMLQLLEKLKVIK